jgi:mono/diheme cytochrome c family protein
MWGAGIFAMLWTGCGGSLVLPDLPPGDAAAGRHLGEDVLRCGACHGADLGGDGAAPNLTAGEGGVASRYDARAWATAVWGGRSADGEPLAGKPLPGWSALTARDLADLSAWLGALPPVDRAVGDGPSGWPTLWGPSPVPEVRAPARPDAPYGAWLGEVAGCAGCHADGLVAWAQAGHTGAELAVAIGPAGPAGHAGGWPGLTLTELDALWVTVRYGGGE